MTNTIVRRVKERAIGWSRSAATGALPIIGLITMLLALALLQLRWSEKVSEAERDRLQQNLQRATAGLQSEFAQDLLEISEALQASETRSPDVVLDHLFDRYVVWRRISGYTPLIRDLYILRPEGTHPAALLRLNPQTRKLEPPASPAVILTASPENQAGLKALLGNSRVWAWDDRTPALLHPIYAQQGNSRPGASPQLFGYLIVVFDVQDLENNYLPELANRYFPLSSGFLLQLVQQDQTNRTRLVLYQSGKDSPSEVFNYADAAIPLLNNATRYGGLVSQPAEPAKLAAARPLLISFSSHPRWSIAVRHRSGSVDAAVGTLRRRNLAVSVLVLAMLLVSLLTILAAGRRRRRLAQMQMEFASSVSHELRTPLAVISSAAENLADGVVLDSERVRSYGVLIHQESQRLAGMVEHILDFAHLNSTARRYELTPVAVRDLLQPVIEQQRAAAEQAGVAVDLAIAPDLPLLLTNLQVLQQCVQNLLSNAIKYGGNSRDILVSAQLDHSSAEPAVLISVHDFGAGLSQADLAHIFEAFYRGQDARDSRIHGTGLGLSITRGLIESLNGRVSAISTPGKGSVFTLHVPSAPAPDQALSQQ